jgi:hypothetical protein
MQSYPAKVTRPRDIEVLPEVTEAYRVTGCFAL